MNIFKKQNIDEKQINYVYYFQMIILNAIRNGIFILNNKNLSNKLKIGHITQPPF